LNARGITSLTRTGTHRRLAESGKVRALVAVVCAFLSLWPAHAQQSRSHGRLFPPQDLGLLEAPDRDQWQRPHRIMDALGVADGSVVADIGAGSGWFTIRLARRIGPRGLVYAQDVQPAMLNAISRRVQREGLNNVRPVLGHGADPNLPSGRLDAALLVDAFHEIEDRVTMLTNIARALKPHGRIGVVDFRPEGSGPGPDPEERVSPAEVIRNAERAGLRLVRSEEFLPFQYFLIFTTATASDASQPR
jgi:ubiquinone/menaquinone biosynthesis C-methylase UbiE